MDNYDPDEEKKAKEEMEKRRESVRACFYGPLRDILATEDGRMVIWEMIQLGCPDDSNWASSAIIHWRAGMRDYSQALISMVRQCGEDVWLMMQYEGRKRAAAESGLDYEQLFDSKFITELFKRAKRIGK